GAFLGTVDQRYSREANLLASGVRLANRAIFEAARSNPEWQGMGTTVDGDRLLLCSDGLTGMVDDARIGALLSANQEPETTCSALVEEANANGGRDNVTVLVLAFQEQKG